MKIENIKIIGGIGALLMLVGPILGSYASILGLVGLVLLLVAFNGLANFYNDRSIFRNVLYGGIALIAGVAIAVIIIVVAASGMLTLLGIPTSSWADTNAWQSIDWNSVNVDALMPYVGAMVGALFVIFAFAVLAAIMIRKSLNSVAQRSGTALFATSGLLLLIGAILTIIVVGFILLWIALLLLAIAFFVLKVQPQPIQGPMPGQMQGQMPGQVFCANCGKPVPPGSPFCPYCGAKQQ